MSSPISLTGRSLTVVIYLWANHVAFLQPNQVEVAALPRCACCQRFQWSSPKTCSKDGGEQRQRKKERLYPDHKVSANKLWWEHFSWGLSTTADPCSSSLCQHTPGSPPSHSPTYVLLPLGPLMYAFVKYVLNEQAFCWRVSFICLIRPEEMQSTNREAYLCLRGRKVGWMKFATSFFPLGIKIQGFSIKLHWRKMQRDLWSGALRTPCLGYVLALDSALQMPLIWWIDRGSRVNKDLLQLPVFPSPLVQIRSELTCNTLIPEAGDGSANVAYPM